MCADKLCDQISDRIVDGHLKRDRDARVAVEVVVKNNALLVLGEISSRAPMGKTEIELMVRQTLAEIGYDDELHKGETGMNFGIRLTFWWFTNQHFKLSFVVANLKVSSFGGSPAFSVG